MSDKTLLSIVTPCYNEQDNVDELYMRVKAAIAPLDKYKFEIIFIDNASKDDTVIKLKRLAAVDPMVKIIVNTRILQSSGAATIYLASDLQDPPELIPEMIRHWEDGFKLVMATKPVSKSNALIHGLRKAYYRVLDGMSDITLTKDATGFGLYDHEVLEHLRKIEDPYPFLRGLICELGYETKVIPFEQPRRMRGISKNNFYSLYDIAMLGVVSHSKVPIRVAAFLGFFMGAVSVLVAFVFLILKLIFWNDFPLGIAPVVIGLFLLFGMQLFFIGIIGEYIASIHTYIQKRPVVVEKERINF
jgi:glycosyltransferase involved in cell wall biosynthesis